MSLSNVLFGDRDAAWRSALPSAEAAARLDAIVDPQAQAVTAFERAKRARQTRSSEVLLQREHAFRNDFAPIFRGQFEDDGDGGSVLRGRFCVRGRVKFYLVATACFAVSASAASLIAGKGMPWLAIPAVAFVVASSMVLRHNLRPGSRDIAAMEGTIEEALQIDTVVDPDSVQGIGDAE